jgi:flagellar basal body-associated protein FliL
VIALLVVIIVLLVGLTAATYLLGFKLGGESSLEQLTQVRAEAAQARRQMDVLTRQAFVAMLDEARRQQGSRE